MIPHEKSKAYLLIGGVLLIAVLIVVGVYLLLQSKQLYKGQAEAPTCHNGAPPLPLMPGCERGEGDPGCPAPDVGQCKKKGVCYECRYETEGLKMICPCVSPTPTTAQKQICEAPKACLPIERCAPGSAIIDTTPATSVGGNQPICTAGTVCCEETKTTDRVTPTPTGQVNKTPLVTPTITAPSTPTATPTTPPIGGPQSTPTPTTVSPTSSRPTATNTPTNATSSPSSTPNPTTVPSLPKAGMPNALYVIVGVGLLVLLVGFAL